MMSFLVRVIISFIAFILSSAVCATVFYLLKKQGQGIDPLGIDPQIFLYDVGGYLLDGLKNAFEVGPVLTFSPILIAIMVGFLFRIRTLFYYVPVGGLALVAMIIVMQYNHVSAILLPDEDSLYLYLMSGAAAGFSYWLIGGANAVPKQWGEPTTDKV